MQPIEDRDPFKKYSQTQRIFSIQPKTDEERKKLERERMSELEKGSDDEDVNRIVKDAKIIDSRGKTARLGRVKHIKNVEQIQHTLKTLSKIPQKYNGLVIPNVEIPSVEDCAIVPIVNGPQNDTVYYVMTGGADLLERLKNSAPNKPLTKYSDRVAGNEGFIPDLLNIFLIAYDDVLKFGGTVRDGTRFCLDQFAKAIGIKDEHVIYGELCNYLQEIMKLYPGKFDNDAIEEAGEFYKRIHPTGAMLLNFGAHKDGEIIDYLTPVNETPPLIDKVLKVIKPKFKYLGTVYDDAQGVAKDKYEIIYRKEDMQKAYPFGRLKSAAMLYLKFHSTFDLSTNDRAATAEESKILENMEKMKKA